MDSMALQMIRIAFRVIADRVLTLVSLFMTFGLSCWVMLHPTKERIIMAAFFALVVFFPALMKEKTSKGTDDEQG